MFHRRIGLLLALTCWGLPARAPAEVRPAALLVSEGLNASEIDRVLRARLRQLNACWDRREAAGVALVGKVTLEWTVSAKGIVTAAVVAEKSDVHDEALNTCLLGRLRRLRLAKPAAEGTVTWVLELRATTKAGEAAGTLLGGKKSKGDAGLGALGAVLRGTAGGSGASASAGGKMRGGVGSTSSLTVTRGYGSGTGSAGHVRTRSTARSTMGIGSVSPGAARAVVSEPAVLSAPGLKAGRHDDNKQYNRFVEFLAQHQSSIPYPLDVSERIVVRALDQHGASLHNCAVEVTGTDGERLARSVTFADGSTHFFPSDAGKTRPDYVVDATCGAVRKQGQIGHHGPRTLELAFDIARQVPNRVPLDIAIVIDTTGSMGGQIARLKRTLRDIHLQLTELPTRPNLRFGLVAYRDRGDDYVTRVTPFTTDVEAFRSVVDRLAADGGGDTPEELQQALHQALTKLDWRAGAVRLGFVIADAMPHTDYPNQAFTYRDAMRTSLERGIKWSMVGAGGLPLGGELIFRQIAQYTMGEYVFVTPSEVQRDSEGGAAEASHHVGTNYSVENLDQAIVRIVRRELSYLTDTPRDFDYTIVAKAASATPRDKVLAPAVQEVLRQLTDYCAIRLKEKTPVAVVPVDAPDEANRPVAEYLGDQLTLSASRRAELKVVERDLRAVAQEQKIQLSDLFEAAQTVQFGKLVGAELLIVARLTVRGQQSELYAKLVRVETGEILSAAKVQFEGETSYATTAMPPPG